MFGPVTLALLQAIPEVERRLGRPVTLVGGLAVLSRLGTTAHRVTTDVDTVDRRADGERGQLEILLASGATAIDGAGVMVAIAAGEIRVDVLEISEQELVELPDDPTGRLYTLAHDWALSTASPLQICASAGGSTFEHAVTVAGPGPLIATKPQALPDRSKASSVSFRIAGTRPTVDTVTDRCEIPRPSGAGSQMRCTASTTRL